MDMPETRIDSHLTRLDILISGQRSHLYPVRSTYRLFGVQPS